MTVMPATSTIPAQRTSTPSLRRPHDRIPSPTRVAGVAATATATAIAAARIDHALEVVRRRVPAVMTVSLALLFLWFGALKLVGSSPVTTLVSATLPWFDPDVLMPALGGVEVLLAVGLLVDRARHLVLVVLAAHLSGTFLSFLMAPELMFQGGHPLLLTVDGEFVLKNLVLVSAALLLAGHHRTSTPRTPQPAAV